MNRSTFSLEIFGDHMPLGSNFMSSGDNHRHIEKMKEILLKAIDSELTEKQKTILNMFYFDGMSVTEISKNIGVNKSTVSRHLKRSKERLKNALKYGMYPLWYN